MRSVLHFCEIMSYVQVTLWSRVKSSLQLPLYWQASVHLFYYCNLAVVMSA